MCVHCRSDTFAVAEQLGVGACLQTAPSLSPQRIAQELVKLLPPHGPDVVIDCVGFDATLQVHACMAAWLQLKLVSGEDGTEQNSACRPQLSQSHLEAR